LISEITRPSRPWSKALSWGIKSVVTIAALSYIILRLRKEPAANWQAILSLDLSACLLIASCVSLAPLNWALESLKWRLMVRPYYPEISFGKAYRAVITGISTGIFTPNGLGAFVGRVMSLRSGYRVEAIVLSFVDGIAQMAITLWMGGIASLYFLFEKNEQIQQWLHLSPTQLHLVQVALGIAMLSSLFLAIFPQIPVFILRHLKLNLTFFQRIVEAFSQVERKRLAAVLVLGISRYLVFSFQYILLMQAFGYTGSIPFAFAMTSTVFLLKSLVPSIALSELGIRESVALAVMGTFGVGALTAFSSTFLLYLINIILPALIGLRFVMKMEKTKTPS